MKCVLACWGAARVDACYVMRADKSRDSRPYRARYRRHRRTVLVHGDAEVQRHRTERLRADSRVLCA